jgi:hypothetical protein
MSSAMQQTADLVFMVRPASFGFNAETAGSNALQQAQQAPPADTNAVAVREFDSFVRQLRAEGVEVLVAEDRAPPQRPDAVFPNNWVSFHADGTLVLYPMLAANRRLERRPELLERVLEHSGFRVRRRLDLTAFEEQGIYLEGTGSLVLDHSNRVAYAVPSPRTDPALARRWCSELGYDCELFAAADAAGTPYYHTNVVLSIGTRFAVIVAEALPAQDRARVLERLAATGREVIAVSRAQAADFCANILELSTWDEALGDSSVLAMSQRARAAFAPAAFARLQSCVDRVVAAPLDLIERLGGGGARCMLAEVFTNR